MMKAMGRIGGRLDTDAGSSSSGAGVHPSQADQPIIVRPTYVLRGHSCRSARFQRGALNAGYGRAADYQPRSAGNFCTSTVAATCSALYPLTKTTLARNPAMAGSMGRPGGHLLVRYWSDDREATCALGRKPGATRDYLEPERRVELLTYALRVRCSTN